MCKKHKPYAIDKARKHLGFTFCFAVCVLGFSYTPGFAQTLSPVADAYTRNGSFATVNYGTDPSLVVKSSSGSGYTRFSYLKFSLTGISGVATATLRIYGQNVQNTSTINISAYGVDNDTWTENGITWNNQPTPLANASGSAAVNSVIKYYDLDVTDYVKTQFSGDKVVTILVKDPANTNVSLSFSSRENTQNRPQLVITAPGAASNALLFVENLDKFPANDRFAFSRIQIPWLGLDSITYNHNHDSLKVRIHNKGMSTLSITNFILSNTTTWKIDKLNGAAYNPASTFPLNITSGNFVDLIVKFIAKDAGTRAAILHETLTIISNDDKFPSKKVFLDGLWQKSAEGSHEPYAEEIMKTYGFTTKTGYVHVDPDDGDSTKLKGSEIKPGYFVRANTSLPVTVTQMAAYHGCCSSAEKIMWYLKGSTSTITILCRHLGSDAQMLLPRNSSGSGIAASGIINPTGAFGFRVGNEAWMDASKNWMGKIGIRVWKAIDSKSFIIPNTYIISNDYLSDTSNYDYNDNMYYVTNVKPYIGTAFYSELKPTPSALDFGEKVLQTTNTLQLSLSSLGKTYSDGSQDPPIVISSVAVTGENQSEFSATMPAATTLNPQQNTALTVTFKPVSQGLKIADLLIYYNNSLAPLRVPLYGIAKASGTTVTVNYRIKAGSSTSITVNGKTWVSDAPYAFDNLEPYKNTALSQVACTDDDALYLSEQSSNGDKLPFRYQIPVSNGSYVVRLHFAEIVWGGPGSGFSKGGPGSRVMSVKLENQYRVINLDVAQEVGVTTAVIKNFPVTVTDGKIDINFSASVNRPMVNAIEVYHFNPSARPANEIDSSSLASVANLPAENNFEKPKLYPNPLHNKFTIEFPGSYQGRYIIEIIDLMGRKYNIGETVLKPGRLNMDMDISRLDLKPGVYSLRIQSDSGKSEVTKLIIE